MSPSLPYIRSPSTTQPIPQSRPCTPVPDSNPSITDIHHLEFETPATPSPNINSNPHMSPSLPSIKSLSTTQPTPKSRPCTPIQDSDPYITDMNHLESDKPATESPTINSKASTPETAHGSFNNIVFDDTDNNYDPCTDDPSILISYNKEITDFKFLSFLPRNFHIPLNEECSNLFNEFRKLQDKFILSVLHLSTLLIYHQHNFVPRGLILSCNPQALLTDNFDKTLYFFWKSTLHNSSIVLLEHLINHYLTHLYRITPRINTLLLTLISKLDPLTSICTLARLKKYALRSWRTTIREKNRKLYVDLNTSNDIRFSDTLLSALYQNPNQNMVELSKLLPFRTPSNKLRNTTNISKNAKSKSRQRNRRFIKNSIYREYQKNLDNETLDKTSVVNLSDYVLNTDETTVLSRNLKFCPTPDNYDPVSLSCDLFKFARRLRLKEFHFDKSKDDNYDENHISNHPKLKKHSTFTPKAGRDVQLDAFIEGVTSEVMSKTHKPLHSNLSDRHKSALDNLKNNDSITIKPADKGGAIVVQNTKDYIKECNRQLTDQNFYKQIDKDPTTKFNNTIKSTLQNAVKKNDIDADFSKLLIERNPTAARFYTVPKIHKPNNPGRPIISGNGCPTEKISVFVDSFLQPLAMDLDSYVQDDIDFLRHIEDINNNDLITEDTLLCTMDVSALYTNIPHTDGTDACREYLDTRQDKSTSTSFICKLITLILTMNNFIFNGLNYLQINGTAMGTCMAPNYANLFMGSLETKFLHSCLVKPTKWLRYIDDIFIIWNDGKEKLLEFISAANKFHPSIKFTYEISDKVISFLDLTIHKGANNKLETDLFSKPTNAHLYLHYSSCHPRHTKNSLPFSLAYRLLRICSTDNFLTKRLNELRQFLLNRHYKPKIIDAAFDKIRKMTRQDSLKRKNKKTSKRVPFVTTFHPGLPNVPQIIRKYLPILHNSQRCKEAIPECPIVSFRRPKNLKDILVKAKVTQKKINGFCGPCNDLRCLTCCSGLFSKSIPMTSVNDTFNIDKHLTCNSYNVIYVVTCRRCKKQYVGKTETPLNFRVNNHRSFINSNKKDPLSRHFNSDNHSFEDYQITAIDMIPYADTHTICNKETFYIKLFNTIYPNGINERDQAIYPIARH